MEKNKSEKVSKLRVDTNNKSDRILDDMDDVGGRYGASGVR